ncbi:MAG: Gfo/Idh/MocA family protein [Sphingobacteriaceae bacterium]
MSPNRRKFLQNASILALGTSFAPALPSFAANLSGSSFQKTFSANDTVRIALIGCKNMGWVDLTETIKHPGVVCIALCDVDSNILNQRAAELEKITGKKAILYKDYRKLLANKDIDAVIIGTPDHWHCLQMVEACASGKDVYVEKPIGNSIEECNLMVAAAKRYKRVVQVGQWQRSDPHWIDALAYVHSGQLGKIRTTTTWALTNYGRDFPVQPDGPVPAGVDYEMWLGPATKRPFNPNRFHGTFRYFWDYAGGLMTDWGVHMVDMALAGINAGAPLSAAAIGGQYGFPDNAYETPETMNAIFDFGNATMLWQHSMGASSGAPFNRGEPGISFVGNNGTLVADRSKWEVIPEKVNGKALFEAPKAHTSNGTGLAKHTQNWLDCIRSREKTNCTIEMGRNAALNAQIGNIAYRLGRKVFWDEQKGMFKDDKQADQMAKAQYHNGWKLPKV